MLLHLPTQKVVELDVSCINFILSRKESFYLTNEGKIVNNICDVTSDHVILHCRLHGGKGAFGSLLRFIGSQIEKTTNREAMRDLSGRRLHDVNNEQKLQQWAQKQTERQQQKDQEKEEKLKRLKDGPSHRFEDQKYFEQNSAIRDNLEDALNSALSSEGVMEKLVQSSSSVVSKNKSSGKGSNSSAGNNPKSGKHSKGAWMMGLPEDIDSDDLSSDSESEDEMKDSARSKTKDSKNLESESDKDSEPAAEESCSQKSKDITPPESTISESDKVAGFLSKPNETNNDATTNRKRTSSDTETTGLEVNDETAKKSKLVES